MKDFFLKAKLRLKVLIFLIKHESKRAFTSPLAYIILIIFILIQSIIVFGVFNFVETGRAEMQLHFASIVFTFIIIIPAITMSSISKEKDNGTLSFILSQPINEIEFIITKFIVTSFFIIFMLLFSVPFTVFIGNIVNLDTNQIFVQYIGVFLVGLSLASIGLASSSIFKNEISALLLSIIISVLFMLSTSATINLLPSTYDPILDKLSLLTHFQSISRGVIYIRDILYFVMFIFSFLCISYFMLVKDRIARSSLDYLRITLVTLIITTLALAIGFYGQELPGRFDLTEGQRYSLSDQSVTVVNKAEEDLDINLYVTSNLPIEFQAIYRDVVDLLRDYENIDQDKINLTINYTDKSDTALNKAKEIGLEEILFAVDDSDSIERTIGYFGISFEYKDKIEILSVTPSIENLEFEVTKKINNLTGNSKANVLLVENVVRDRNSDMTILFKELNDLYNITTIDVKKDQVIPENIDVILLAGPNVEYPNTFLENLKQYFKDGGSIFMLTNSTYISPASFTPIENVYSLATFFEEYGVKVEDLILYDLEKNNQIDTGDGNFVVPTDYPLWIDLNPTDVNHPISQKVQAISFIWANSLDIKVINDKGALVKSLFQTSKNSGKITEEEFSPTDNGDFSTENNDGFYNAVASIEMAGEGKAIVVGDSLFLSDSLIKEEQNLSFVLSSIDWLSGKESNISNIKLKSRSSEILNLSSTQIRNFYYTSIGLPIAVISLTGIYIFYKKYKRSNMVIY